MASVSSASGDRPASTRSPTRGRASSASSQDFHASDSRVRRLAAACPDVARHNACKRLGGARGVLAEIEAHGREAEELHGVAHRAHEIGGDRGELCLLQRVLQHAEIEDQLVGIGVIGARLASAIALGAGDGGVELAQHEGEILAIGLAGIARADGDRVAARLQLAGELGAEAFRHRRGALGDRQIAGKLGDPRLVVPQARRARSA